MSVSASEVMDLREKTGAGILDCRKALLEVNGDFDAAVDWLRAKGIAKAAKTATRAATEGTVYAYIHGGGKLGVLLEVNCETDFVAMSEDFQAFVRDVAMHIAAANPLWVREDEADPAVIERERGVARQQAIESGKPEAIAEKMVAGKINKYLAESTLLLQPFIKDEDKTVGQLQTALAAKTGENIQIRRFTRWQLGEGLTKKADNFLEEVARMSNG